MALTSLTPTTQQKWLLPEMPQINLVDFFKFYENEPHQAEGVQLLQQSMPDSLLKNGCSMGQEVQENA